MARLLRLPAAVLRALVVRSYQGSCLVVLDKVSGRLLLFLGVGSVGRVRVDVVPA